MLARLDPGNATLPPFPDALAGWDVAPPPTSSNAASGLARHPRARRRNRSTGCGPRSGESPGRRGSTLIRAARGVARPTGRGAFLDVLRTGEVESSGAGPFEAGGRVTRREPTSSGCSSRRAASARRSSSGSATRSPGAREGGPASVRRHRPHAAAAPRRRGGGRSHALPGRPRAGGGGPGRARARRGRRTAARAWPRERRPRRPVSAWSGALKVRWALWKIHRRRPLVPGRDGPARSRLGAALRRAAASWACWRGPSGREPPPAAGGPLPVAEPVDGRRAGRFVFEEMGVAYRELRNREIGGPPPRPLGARPRVLPDRRLPAGPSSAGGHAKDSIQKRVRGHLAEGVAALGPRRGRGDARGIRLRDRAAGAPQTLGAIINRRSSASAT